MNKCIWSRWRQVLVHAVLWLACGACTTVLSSWAIAYAVQPGQYFISFAGDTEVPWLVWGEDRFGLAAVNASPNHLAPSDAKGFLLIAAPENPNPLRTVPHWSWARSRTTTEVHGSEPPVPGEGGPPISTFAGTDFVETATGWPCRSLVSRFCYVGWSPLIGRFEVGLPVRSLDRRRGVALLPLQPIWRGFAANSMIFGGVGWMCALWIRRLRRQRRRRCGRCTGCGYNLAGLAMSHCPECGIEDTRLAA
jgi:hypothetical protein